jgi:hypothetical protein
MVLELIAKVLDQGIVHHIEEIVRRRPTLMLLRVEPKRRAVGVSREHHADAGGFFPGCAFNAAKWGNSRRCPCSQQCAPRQYRLRRSLLPEKRKAEESGAPVRRRPCR